MSFYPTTTCHGVSRSEPAASEFGLGHDPGGIEPLILVDHVRSCFERVLQREGAGQ